MSDPAPSLDDDDDDDDDDDEEEEDDDVGDWLLRAAACGEEAAGAKGSDPGLFPLVFIFLFPCWPPQEGAALRRDWSCVWSRAICKPPAP